MRQRGRPIVPAIERSAVIEEALTIIDSEGIEALSMRVLAERLGVKAPSLYNHFDGKDSILAAVAQRILEDLPTRAAAGEPWQRWLVHAMIEYRRILLAHPNAISIMTRMPLAGSISDSTFEHAVEVMKGDGVPAALTRTIAEAAESLVTGWVLIALNGSKVERDATSEAAHRLIVETNTMDEDSRFQTAAQALISGFVAAFAPAQ